MEKILEKLEHYILYLTVFLIPIVVLPIFSNPFTASKLAVLSFGVALALLVKVIRTVFKGSLELSVGSFDFPVFLLAVAYIISAIFKTPNKMEAFFLPGTASFIVAATLLYFLVNQLKQAEKKTLEILLFASGVAVSVLVLLTTSRVFEKIPQLPVFMKDRLFTPLGGSLPTAIFITALLPLTIGIIVREKELIKKIFYAISLTILLLGLAISIFNILPGKDTSPRLVDYRTSWFVAVDTLKESPVWGIGPGNYLTAFNRFRPLSYNQIDSWAIRYTSARNFYLTLLTETGFVGIAGIILILLVAYRLLRNNLRENKAVGWGLLAINPNLFSLTTLFILLVLFSATPTLVVLIFIFLSLSNETSKINLNLSVQATREASPIASRLPAIIVCLPIAAALIVFGLYAPRALAAEAKFKKSLDALARNDGVLTYNLMRESIGLNPFIDRYHASYSQVNLALANSIAQNRDISEQDRATIAQLIQQAIREGKATVTLNFQRAGNWDLLARIYQAIMPFSEGADAFAIQTFNQAIALDPINPDLRIALGGVHYALGDYDDAIRAFELATFAKPDHANAHYNLATALREKGEIEKAINEMTIVLSLVDRNSQDYELAKTELENLEKKVPSEEAEATESLTPPQPAEEPVIEPPIELPEEASPPKAPEKITPSPTPTPEK
ncbi:MAG: tetratricopeptide repeat protein [Microgenomates group bacterium]